MRDLWFSIRNFIVRKSMYILPFVVIIAVAVTVAVALRAGRNRDAGEIGIAADEVTGTALTEENETDDEDEDTEGIGDIPLEINDNDELKNLIETYYTALADGDVDTIASISTSMSDASSIRIQELSKYLESISVEEIYVKSGLYDNSWIAYAYVKNYFISFDDPASGVEVFYVCEDENNSLYLKSENMLDEAEQEYIMTVSSQEDIKELDNRIDAEYSEQMHDNPELAEYVEVVADEVSKATGLLLAALNLEEEEDESEAEETAEESEESTVSSGQTLYATASTTVNIRVSDSEQADRAGKVPGGETVEVLEQMANGWSSIVYDGINGYIKSEYLIVEGEATSSQTQEGEAVAQTAQSVDSGTKMTAKSNLNMRSSASENADKLCTVVGGDTVEVLSVSGGWSQIRYNGKVGFVKSEYLQ